MPRFRRDRPSPWLMLRVWLAHKKLRRLMLASHRDGVSD
jgi:hypothetical protein